MKNLFLIESYPHNYQILTSGSPKRIFEKIEALKEARIKEGFTFESHDHGYDFYSFGKYSHSLVYAGGVATNVKIK